MHENPERESKLAKEAMDFCQNYLSNVRQTGLLKPCAKDRGQCEMTIKSIDLNELYQIHLNILNNIDEVQDYMVVHT